MPIPSAANPRGPQRVTRKGSSPPLRAHSTTEREETSARLPRAERLVRGVVSGRPVTTRGWPPGRAAHRRGGRREVRDHDARGPGRAGAADRRAAAADREGPHGLHGVDEGERGVHRHPGAGRPEPVEGRARQRRPARGDGRAVRRGQGVHGRLLPARRRERGARRRTGAPDPRRADPRPRPRDPAGGVRGPGRRVSRPGAVDEGLWRELAPQTLARLVRSYGGGQFDLCEDAVQDALLDAQRQWATRRPDDPQAWLVTTARRRYVDRVRSDVRRREREDRVVMLEAPLGHDPAQSDDTLLLLLLCCHPELPRSGQVALTLRAVAGLTTAQIANAYQLPESAIAQRITRAKRRLVDADRGFPRPDHVDERLGPVLDVLYVMLTEAHHTTTGAPARDSDLAAEAIHLARLLRQAVPGSTEVAGLLALMLLTEARQPARVGPLGRLVPLDEQDRTRWDQAMIDEGLSLLDLVTPGEEPGPYLLQACIAGLHATAPDTGSTDWAEIHALYVLLEHVTEGRNPTITLNRIVAQSMTEGTESALSMMDELATRHPRLARVDAVRAHLLERAGRRDEAAAAYRCAIAATVNVAEQRHLRERLRRLGGTEA